MRINLTRSLTAIVFSVVLMTGSSPEARAQTSLTAVTTQIDGAVAQQDDSGPLTVPRPRFQVFADPVETEEPYVHWHAHTGSATECVASLRLQTSAGYEYVSALVVRCDGFVLIPRTALDKIRAGVNADIVVTGAEGETVVAPFPLAGWARGVANDRRVDYALVKVNGHHIRCLHLLAGGNSRESDAVNIVYSVPNVTATACVCTAVTLQARVGQSADHGAHFTLEAVKDAGSATIASTSIPIGATVVDAETGAALGMVTSNTSTPTFSTFLRFNNCFNETGLTPDRNALKMLAGTRSGTPVAGTDPGGNPGEVVGGICYVRGGPLTLQGTLRDEFLKMYNTDVVCTPDFQIEQVPVTNGDFRAWMQLPHVHDTAPQGWSVDELTTPVRRADFPVTGVPAGEAMDYLVDHEMRLPTEVEWQRASKVGDFKWLEVRWSRSAELASLSDGWRSGFTTYWSNLYLIDRYQLSQATGGSTPPPEFAPGESPSELEYVLRNKAVALAGSIGNALRENSLGRFIHPVRQIFEDASVYGMLDATLNAPELTLPRGDYETFGYKPYADDIDPYVSWTKYHHRGGTVFDRPDTLVGDVEDDLFYYEIGPTDVPAYYMLTELGIYAEGEFSAGNMGAEAGDPGQKVLPPGRNKARSGNSATHFISRGMSFKWHGFTDAEFRGAR